MYFYFEYDERLPHATSQVLLTVTKDQTQSKSWGNSSQTAGFYVGIIGITSNESLCLISHDVCYMRKCVGSIISYNYCQYNIFFSSMSLYPFYPL